MSAKGQVGNSYSSDLYSPKHCVHFRHHHPFLHLSTVSLQCYHKLLTPFLKLSLISLFQKPIFIIYIFLEYHSFNEGFSLPSGYLWLPVHFQFYSVQIVYATVLRQAGCKQLRDSINWYVVKMWLPTKG